MASAQQPDISVFVITQNEAHQIDQCLESLRWADEIVVVDGGSVDGTAEIARRYTPYVYVHEFTGYAEQRRYALERVRGRWVMAVDSDERVTPELAEEIRRVVKEEGGGYDGFYVARKSFFLGRWIRRAGWYPGYQLRLCRRDRVRVTERAVHEGLTVEGPVGYLREPLLHFTQPDLETAIERANRYSTLEVNDRAQGVRVRPLDFFLHPLATFLRKYVGLLGALEGMHGFLLSAVSALYNMLLYMKLWEARNRVQPPRGAQWARVRGVPVSVLVIARDEEVNIQDCLKSARWAEEVVLVDTGSTDATVERAQGLADRIERRPWEGYAATRQRALSDLRHPWVLWLDADERVTPELAAEIGEVVRRGSAVAYEMPRMAWFLGRWIRHSGWYPGYVVRLFRKEAARFDDSLVHEGLRVNGPVGRLRHPLLHLTDPDLFHYMVKFNRYTRLAARQEKLRGRSFSLWKLLTHPPHTFIKMYLLRSGFRDGVQGWMLALLSSAYVFFKYAKLWEMERNPPVGRPRQDPELAGESQGSAEGVAVMESSVS